VSAIYSHRWILTKSCSTDPALSSSQAPAATTSITHDLLRVIFTSSS
jgi:hypothetical protein